MKRFIVHPRPAERNGTIIPLLVFAILAAAAAGALVLDRLWIDAAQVQLRAAAEAASLAAAGRLVCDDRLRGSGNSLPAIEEARSAAVRIAGINTVIGRPVKLDLRPEGDVRFGDYLESSTTGERLFLETDICPTTVIVTTQCLRERKNPLLLFFRGVTGQHVANAQAQAAATIDNRVYGIRPLPGSAVPCLPVGILESDATGQRENTWHQQIEQREGQDRYGYDESTFALINEPDGIPEMVLSVGAGEGGADMTIVRILDLGNNLVEPTVKAQIAGGLTGQDLSSWGGELVFVGSPLALNSSASLVSPCVNDLVQQIGRARICLLYQDNAHPEALASDQVTVTRMVTIRILTLEHADNGPVQIVVQPSVVATRAAVLNDQSNAVHNPYVYNLSLTH